MPVSIRVIGQPVVVAMLSCIAAADVVVKDRVTDASVWSTAGLIADFESTTRSADHHVACTFTGNGAVITQVRWIFWHPNA